MPEEKGYITISVPNNTTKEEIKEIRQQFQKDQISQHYKLNILISGNRDIQTTIKDILLAYIKNKTF